MVAFAKYFFSQSCGRHVWAMRATGTIPLEYTQERPQLHCQERGRRLSAAVVIPSARKGNASRTTTMPR